MAVKKITKVTVVKKDGPKKDKAPMAKVTKHVVGKPLQAGTVSKVGKVTTTFKAPDSTGFGGSDYIKRNYVEGTSKTDSALTIKKKKVVAPKEKGEKPRKIMLSSPVSHY